MGGPIPGPLGPGALGDLLQRELKVGEKASVLLDFPHKAGTEIDANLYKKFPDGRIYRIDHLPLDPKTLERLR